MRSRGADRDRSRQRGVAEAIQREEQAPKVQMNVGGGQRESDDGHRQHDPGRPRVQDANHCFLSPFACTSTAAGASGGRVPSGSSVAFRRARAHESGVPVGREGGREVRYAEKLG